MDFYFVTPDGRTSQSCHYCDVETSVKCLDVSYSEFNLNSINTHDTYLYGDDTSSRSSTGNDTYKPEDERSKLIGEA